MRTIHLTIARYSAAYAPRLPPPAILFAAAASRRGVPTWRWLYMCLRARWHGRAANMRHHAASRKHSRYAFIVARCLINAALCNINRCVRRYHFLPAGSVLPDGKLRKGVTYAFISWRRVTYAVL